MSMHLHVCVRAGRWKVVAQRRCAAALLPQGSCPASPPLSIRPPAQPADINYEHMSSVFNGVQAGHSSRRRDWLHSRALYWILAL